MNDIFNIETDKETLDTTEPESESIPQVFPPVKDYYEVQVECEGLCVRTGAGTTCEILDYINGKPVIELDASQSTAEWGKLYNKQGYIHLGYTHKL